jgi:hypothetical protein
MKIRSLTPNADYPSILVRYKLGDEIVCVDNETGEGVDIPDDATLVDISFYGSPGFTQQVVFDPAFADANF